MYEFRRRSMQLTWLAMTGCPDLMATLFAPIPAGIVLLASTSSAHFLYALLLLLLPVVGALSTLRLSLSADAEGLTIQNPLLRRRLRWDEIERFSSRPTLQIAQDYLEMTVDRTGTWLLPDGGSISVVASWGLQAEEMEALASRVMEVARLNGHNLDVERTTSWAEFRAKPPASLPPFPDRRRWKEHAQAEVACMFCGRVAPAREMQPFGEASADPKWYCRDQAACDERVAANLAT